ncbi:MAG TPA: LppP/LprE family lipoprotein [Chloroflexota bacterium]|nr:LppP/LprE family lipoprotein [Chloroflexota bacterium]
MRVCVGFIAALLLFASAAQVVVAQQAAWLDGPLDPWNAPAMAVPRSPVFTSFAPTQCLLNERPAAVPEESQVLMAGWKLLRAWPAQRRADVTVVMATSDHDGMCRPTGFNAFVFAGGRFAGTIAPEPMGARTDGTLARPPSFLPDGRLDASFVRFAPSDPLCCPSRPAARVLYRVEVTDAGPVLLAERPGAAGVGGPRLPATGWGPAEVAGESCVATVDDACLTD